MKISHRVDRANIGMPMHEALTSVIGASLDDHGAVADMALVLVHHLAGLVAYTQKPEEHEECAKQIGELFKTKLTAAVEGKKSGTPYCKPELLSLQVNVQRSMNNFQFEVTPQKEKTHAAKNPRDDAPIPPNLERDAERATQDLISKFTSAGGKSSKTG